MDKRKSIKNLIIHGDKGFTLVELIVVLALLGILLAISVFGMLSWQDWARFKQENTAAETIFYAMQNQLTEINNSGMYSEKVEDRIRDIMSIDSLKDRCIGTPDAHDTYFNGSKIKCSDNEFFVWDNQSGVNTVSIWANTPSGVDDDAKKYYQGSIYYLSAEKGDYDKYLSGSLGDKKDAIFLFDLIAPYISDRSILNGAIVVEFSPEAAQVLSVCYSDNTEKLSYKTENNSLNILDRSEESRRDAMLGYYAADSLSVPLVGRSEGIASEVVLVNSNTLELLVNADKPISNNWVFTVGIYKNEVDANPLMKLSFKGEAIKDNLLAAASSPAEAKAEFFSGRLSGEKNVRVPVWKSSELDITTNKNVYTIHIVLDAADVQAQSYQYNKLLTVSPDEDDVKKFLQTYSFYRFGLGSDISSICCGVGITEGSNVIAEDSSRSNIENPYFASVQEENGTDVYKIANGRHLYNVRFETDYKTRTDKREFQLVKDIDWDEFIGKGPDDSINYYLTSYNGSSGINYAGVDHYINHSDSQFNTAEYTFPGFRSLGYNDTFTGKSIDESGNDVVNSISNLTISFAGNVSYQVYDPEGWGDDPISDFGKYKPNSAETLNSVHRISSVEGRMPVGLFCENLGTISDLVLDKHKVIGMEKIDDVLLYTNMVGGFVGNNMGVLSNLKLMNTGDKTSVNGRKDVGGILGRQTWVHDSISDEVVLANLENYGTITGMENVGGIIGRAFIIRDKNDYSIINTASSKIVTDRFMHAQKRYDDNYTRYGEFDDTMVYSNGTSLSNQSVKKVKKITISDCKNRGIVCGDECIYNGNTVYAYDNINKYTTGTISDIFINASNDLYKCSFIGGIAGLVMDGYISDGRLFPGTNNDACLSAKDFEAVFANNGILVEKCSSYYEYDDTVIGALTSQKTTSYSLISSSDKKVANVRNRLQHDYFVGGIVGYSRLAHYKDCSNSVDDKYSDKQFVFGRNYVGGMFGCFDVSVIDSGYNVENYCNAIGIMDVGGFAGGIGAGDEDQDNMNFRYPSWNEGSQASQTRGVNTKSHISGITNKAAVLGIRREIFGYDNSTLMYKQDNALNLGVKSQRVLDSDIDANIGGVAGILRVEVCKFNNIQDDNAKILALKLVGFSDGDTTTLINSGKNMDVSLGLDSIDDVREYSMYGGNGVGGVFGKTMVTGKYNRNKDDFGVVDAVVYGWDAVGGVVGGTDTSGTASLLGNQPLSNAVIIGHNVVGGFAGRSTVGIQTEFYTREKGKFDKPYHVYGNYAVGGFIGMGSEKNGTKATQTIGDIYSGFIEGRAYVGGFIGVYTTSDGTGSIINGNVNGIKVKADYFAGGVAGAIYQSRNDNKNLKFDNLQVSLDVKNSIESDYFAGGFSGLYAHHKDSNTQYSVVEKKSYFKSVESQLKFNGVKNSNLVTLADNLRGAEDVIEVINSAEKNGALKPNTEMLNQSLNFATGIMPTDTGTVTAEKAFAGGLFGYIPNGMNISVDCGKVRAGVQETNPVHTNVEVKGKLDVFKVFEDDKLPTDVTNIYGDRYISYAGGIIGRNSKGLTIENAAYVGNIKSAGSYIGQICEVNDGIIKNSAVSEFVAGDSENTFTGGLTGLNAASGSFEGDYFTNGIKLTGSAVVGGFIGENVSESFNLDWSLSDAECGEISIKSGSGLSVSGGSSAGMIIGNNSGKIIVSTEASMNFESHKIIGVDSAGVITGVNSGTIMSDYYKIEEPANSNNSTNRYDANDAYKINIRGDFSRVSAAGLVAGRNVGNIQYIITSDVEDGCYINIDQSASSVAGGIAGYNGLDSNGGMVSHCIFNSNPDKFSSNYSAGIVGKAEGDTTIVGCDNHADIFGKDGAAGILATAGTNGTVKIEDCTNTGKIYGGTDSNLAGIAAGTTGNGEITLCRNYGKINPDSASTHNAYGITCDAVTSTLVLKNNLEASGLNEGVENSDNDYSSITTNPIAPDATGERNFYVYGTCDDVVKEKGDGSFELVDIGPGTDGCMYTDIDFESVTDYQVNKDDAKEYFQGSIGLFEAPGRDVLYGFKYHYLRGDNGQGVSRLVAKIDPENGNKIRQLYYDMANVSSYSGGDLNPEFESLLRCAFYIYYDELTRGSGVWSGTNTDYDGLITFILKIVSENKIPQEYFDDPDERTPYNGGYVDGTDKGYGPNKDIRDVDDTTSHWPKQLYYYHDSNGDQLVYHRWHSYYSTGITNLSINPLSFGDSYNNYKSLDAKFVDMAMDEAGRPSTGDWNAVTQTQGFTP